MKTFAAIFALLFAFGAHAQAPAPAQMGITPTTPEVLKTLDSTNTWVPLGTVDPAKHLSISMSAPDQISALQFGARGSSQSTTGAFAGPGSNLFSMASAIDLQVGDDVSIRYEGAVNPVSPPTGMAATPCGTPRSVLTGYGACAAGTTSCTYYAVEDDGLGGHSAPVSVTIGNAQSAQTVFQDIYIKMVPAVNSHTAPIWKNCGSGDKWLLAALPRTVVTLASAGSGYTFNGSTPYHWVATGGGCTVEPHGWAAVGSTGSIVLAGIDPNGRGEGCTSPPTVNVNAIPGIGAGSGGAITLNFLLEAEDAGYIPDWTPVPYDVGRPTTAGNDDLIATIGALSGMQATLCQVGTGVNGVACTPVSAQTSQTRVVFHSWMRVLQNAINAAVAPGIITVTIPCGVYDGEGSLLISANKRVMLSGQSPASVGNCVEFRFKGNRHDVRIASAGGGSGVQNIYFNGFYKTGGGYLYADQSTQVLVTDVKFYREPCPLLIVGNPGHRVTYISGNRAWGYGCATYAMKSSSTGHMWEIYLEGTYVNDGTGNDNNLTATGGLMHDGYDFDGVPTGFLIGETAVSDTWGYGFWWHDDSGWSWDSGGGGAGYPQLAGNQFWHMAGPDSEFARADDFRVDQCQGTCLASQIIGNGSVTGHELYLAKDQQFSVFGGKLTASFREGAWVDGQFVMSGTQLQLNGQLSGPGPYCGVYIGPDATAVAITGNQIGARNPSFNPPVTTSPLCPIQIASANNTGTINITGNTFEGGQTRRIISDTLNPNDTGLTPAPYFSPRRRYGLVISCNAARADLGGRAPVDCSTSLGVSSMPMILPSNGVMANNGAVTLGTALDRAYARAYMYLPAGAIASGSAAGWYYAICATTTACTVYNNVYSTGTPIFPSPATPFVTTGPGAYTQTTGNIAAFLVALAPYQIGPNDGVSAQWTVTYPSNANAKSSALNLASATVFSSHTLTTSSMWTGCGGFLARGATNVQVSLNNVNNDAVCGAGPSTVAPLFSSIDLSSAQNFGFILNISNPTDYMVLQTATITYLPAFDMN